MADIVPVDPLSNIDGVSTVRFIFNAFFPIFKPLTHAIRMIRC